MVFQLIRIRFIYHSLTVFRHLIFITSYDLPNQDPILEVNLVHLDHSQFPFIRSELNTYNFCY